MSPPNLLKSNDDISACRKDIPSLSELVSKVREKTLPDTVGLTVEEALETLYSAGVKEVELAWTQPPSCYCKGKRQKAKNGARTYVARVIAQRINGDKIKLIVSTEAYIQPYKRAGGKDNDESQASSRS